MPQQEGKLRLSPLIHVSGPEGRPRACQTSQLDTGATGRSEGRVVVEEEHTKAVKEKKRPKSIGRGFLQVLSCPDASLTIKLCQHIRPVDHQQVCTRLQCSSTSQCCLATARGPMQQHATRWAQLVPAQHGTAQHATHMLRASTHCLGARGAGAQSNRTTHQTGETVQGPPTETKAWGALNTAKNSWQPTTPLTLQIAAAVAGAA